MSNLERIKKNKDIVLVIFIMTIVLVGVYQYSVHTEQSKPQKPCMVVIKNAPHLFYATLPMSYSSGHGFNPLQVGGAWYTYTCEASVNTRVGPTVKGPTIITGYPYCILSMILGSHTDNFGDQYYTLTLQTVNGSNGTLATTTSSFANGTAWIQVTC